MATNEVAEENIEYQEKAILGDFWNKTIQKRLSNSKDVWKPQANAGLNVYFDLKNDVYTTSRLFLLYGDLRYYG